MLMAKLETRCGCTKLVQVVDYNLFIVVALRPPPPTIGRNFDRPSSRTPMETRTFKLHSQDWPGAVYHEERP